MADQVYNFACTIPAGTAKATPVTIAMNLPLCEVDEIGVEIPSGPAGLMGFAITSDGTNIIPQQSGVFIVVDGQSLTFPLTNAHNSGRWALTGYNTGINPHTVYVRFLVRLKGVGDDGAAFLAPVVPIASFNPGP